MTRVLDWDPNDNGPGSGNGGSGSGNGGLGSVSTSDAENIEYARILIALSEGPIKGLVNGLKSIFFDGTPLQAADGTWNFRGVSVAMTKGTNTQGMIPGFVAAESETVINTKVLAATPVVRTVSTSGLSALRIKISTPRLKTINSTSGAESAAQAQVKIERSSPNWNPGTGLGTWEALTLDNSGVILGKFGSKYTKGFRIELPVDGPWSIRVTRLTPDGDSYTLNETWWDTTTEITDARLRYPNTALLAVLLDAKQFPNVPQVHVEADLREISVPANYDPIARTYATTGPGTTGGIWDGTFKQAWTDNPAWIFYDMATHTRYGAGSFIQASSVTKWDLYPIGQMCDQLVSDGKGGQEPRFRCNTHIQADGDAVTALKNLASAFRGMLYEAGGVIHPVQDVDRPPVAIFTRANVVDGKFTYSATARAARHTAAMVGWIDPAAGYAQAIPEYVADDAAVRRFGLNVAKIDDFGGTSQGQARRRGWWTILTELLRTGMVSFQAGMDSSTVAPGDIVLIDDAGKPGALRMGGRLRSATMSSVVLDAPVTLVSGKSYTLNCRLPNGNVESKPVSTGAGTTSALSVSSAFSQVPPVMGLWVLHEVAAPTLYQVLTIGEKDATNFPITAIVHIPSLYAQADTVNVTTAGWGAGKTLGAVLGLTLSSTTQQLSTRIACTISADWIPVAGASGYEASYSLAYGPWIQMETSSASARVDDVPPGSYRVRVRANFSGGRVGPHAEATLTVNDPSGPPGNLIVPAATPAAITMTVSSTKPA